MRLRLIAGTSGYIDRAEAGTGRSMYKRNSKSVLGDSRGQLHSNIFKALKAASHCNVWKRNLEVFSDPFLADT